MTVPLWQMHPEYVTQLHPNGKVRVHGGTIHPLDLTVEQVHRQGALTACFSGRDQLGVVRFITAAIGD